MTNKTKETQLSEKEVLHIAKLANLVLSPAEVAVFCRQLSETLEYVVSLNEIDTAQAEPTFQTTGLTNIVRKDEVKPSLTQKQALSQAKESHQGFFKVKSIFEPII